MADILVHSCFPHIFAVLQHLLDTHKAFLNGDWPFINAVLGLMSPSSSHPCPICIVSHNNYLHSSRYRTTDDHHSYHPDHSALLTVDPTRIVPTPLHLFLGISNRIIIDVFSELLGNNRVKEILTQVKTMHTPGSGGLSDRHDLNGPEIRKWLKKDCCTQLLATAPTVSHSRKATFSVLKGWLHKLHDYLLHKEEWEYEDITAWTEAVNDIWTHWQDETHQVPFPQLHMLRHTLEFAERHRFLGRASEAQIESCHNQIKRLLYEHHHNLSRDESQERLRRCLADTTLTMMHHIQQP